MKKYTQFSPQTLCFTCAGCNREEIALFPGVTKCDSYRVAYDEYYRSMNKEYGYAIENER
jgi:hypothetical protein